MEKILTSKRRRVTHYSNGKRMDRTRCAKKVISLNGETRQCRGKRGHGKYGMFCTYHKKAEDPLKISSEDRKQMSEAYNRVNARIRKKQLFKRAK